MHLLNWLHVHTRQPGAMALTQERLMVSAAVLCKSSLLWLERRFAVPVLQSAELFADPGLLPNSFMAD